MKLFGHIEQLGQLAGPLSLAIGVFDGVHAGHRAVIKHAITQARAVHGNSVVVSFRPHPQRILNPAVAPRLLTSTPHKLRILQRMGIDNLLMIPFTRNFSKLTSEAFIDQLHSAAAGLHSIAVGQSWAFGRGREGNLDTLRKLGRHYGFQVTGVPEVEYQGSKVSSTRIRKAMAEGNLKAATAMLERPPSLFGTVIEGDQLGRKLGFPTANISVQNEQLPPPGVYAAMTFLYNDPLPSVINLGHKPTVSGTKAAMQLEVHILDFNANLYGTDIEVEILQLLRPEQKFDSLESLKQQIAKDVAHAREVTGKRCRQ